MDELLEAVAKTKNYADKYGQKLNEKQLFLRLISNKVFSNSLIKKMGEESDKNKYWEEKMELAKMLVKRHLSKMKGIKMVGVTGSVAAETAKKEEDIDLLIVTRSDELWWWRLYLRVYVWWHKVPHRRFNKTENKDEFCFNLWLDDNNLTIPTNKRNLKNATDMVLMKVIFDKDNCYQKLLSKNGWVKNYLATGYRAREIETRNQKLETRDKKLEKKKNILKKFVNKILFWGQYVYMWSKIRKKIKFINEGQAFFHRPNGVQ